MVETLNHTSTSISTSASTYELNSRLHDDYRTQTIPRDYNHDYSNTLEDEDNQPPIPPPKDYIESPRHGFGSTSVSSSSLDRNYCLPEGMDVREALAQCEDPALGWSLQFWATIADPVVSLVLMFPSCLLFG
jgi:hypothetical protein